MDGRRKDLMDGFIAVSFYKTFLFLKHEKISV